jgi:hypothetical protein
MRGVSERTAQRDWDKVLSLGINAKTVSLGVRNVCLWKW